MQTESIRSADTASAAYPSAKAKKTAGSGAAGTAGTSARSSGGGQETGVFVEMEGGPAPQTEPRVPESEATLHTGAHGDTTSLMPAIYAFTEAYNTLMDALITTLNEEIPQAQAEAIKQAADVLREAMYRPVGLDVHKRPARRVSLYEIGVAHSPDHRTAGRLTVHEKKLTAALESREADIKALFHNEEEGIPARLRNILRSFMENPASAPVRAHSDEFIQRCALLREYFV